MTGSRTLAAENISIDLGGRTVLTEFSSSIKPGDFIAVVGPNGAGKSTALRAFAGLIKPRSGQVTIDGRPIGSLDRREIGRQIAYLPQDRTVHWALDCAHVAGLGRLPHRNFSAGESAVDKAAVETAMQRMDVLQFAQRPIVALSGGERARVLIARALAQEARYFIADEPTAGLDPAHTLYVMREFARLANDGHGVVTAMHDLSLALRYASRVILLVEGRCIAEGSASSVLKKDLLAQAFGIETIVTTIEGIPVVLPTSPLT